MKPIKLYSKTDLIVKIKSNPAFFAIIVLLFIERVISIYLLKADYSLLSDDMSYVNSGFTFLETGVISCHDTYPTAQIMPGLPLFYALIATVFGKGAWFWRATKLIWASLSVASASYVYKTVNMFAQKRYALLSMIPFFRPDFVWVNNLLLMETPFVFMISALVYYTVKMEQEFREKKLLNGAFVKYLIIFLLGLFMRPTILIVAAVSVVYLLICRYPVVRLIKQVGIIFIISAVLLTPWAIRNYRVFNDFIPMTYGVGNPNLLGTYQGYGYPSDEELDYKTNVSDIIREEYKDFYNEDGSVKEGYERYISLQHDKLKSEYRISAWKERDIKSFLMSYLIIKPMDMIKSIFFWTSTITSPLLTIISRDTLINVTMLNLYVCIASTAAAIILKKNCKPIAYMWILYLTMIYLTATSFSFDRYAFQVLFIRFIINGIGIPMILECLGREIQRIMKESEQ